MCVRAACEPCNRGSSNDSGGTQSELLPPGSNLDLNMIRQGFEVRNNTHTYTHTHTHKHTLCTHKYKHKYRERSIIETQKDCDMYM